MKTVYNVSIKYTEAKICYGIEVYANTTSNHLTKLIMLNNKLLRILQHKPSSRDVS